MKQMVNRNAGRAGIALIILAFASILLSCSEGIFNFNEETGNISISFSADSAVSTDFGYVVFNLANESTNASLRKECSISRDEQQTAECYISRADTGSWHMLTSLYDSNGNFVKERDDYFELYLAQTAIADVRYSVSGELSVIWEKPAGSQPESLLGADKLSALIIASHSSGDPIELTQFQTVLVAGGTGFDTALAGLRIIFPDDGYFDYYGGWARAVNNINVESTPTLLSISREDYFARGTYSITVSDINDVETDLYDECYFNFEPYNGLATLNGNFSTTYNAGGGGPITDTMYDKNGSESAGTYIVYLVEDSDGTSVNGGTLIVYDPATIGSGNLTPATGSFVGGENALLVIATVDAGITQLEIDNYYVNGTTDVSPDKLPGWLFSVFGDRLNYVGLTVESYLY